MWYNLALAHPVVKMQDELIFWRQHDDQEITKGQESFFYLENSYLHCIKTLNNPKIPLSPKEIKLAKKNIHKRFAKNIFRLVLIIKNQKKPIKL